MNFNYWFFLPLFLTVFGCGADQSTVWPQKDNTAVSQLFSKAAILGQIELEELDEASGLANSSFVQDLFWSHNDSGGDPALYLFDREGAHQAKITLDGAENVDWEDMAIGLGPEAGVNYLYVGDIGDNQALRDHLSIYRTPEPNIEEDQALDPIESSHIERIDFIYEDGARDAETLMVDPVTRHIYIITKREPKILLYQLPFPQTTFQMDTAIRVAELPYTLMTGGDISSDGQEILIKNYENIYYWQRSGNEPLENLLVRPGIRLEYAPEPQGEAIAWAKDGIAFYTISEKARESKVEIFVYRRN